MTEYKPRVVDDDIQGELEAFGAVLIIGPKYCGKTTSAMRLQKSAISMQGSEESEDNLSIAKIDLKLILDGENPRLIDEWQVMPRIWDSVRYRVDAEGKKGLFILTGSVNVDTEKIHHSGAGRISVVRMDTMSLFEMGISNGQVSLQGLFDGSKPSVSSDVTIEQIQAQIVHGGWPGLAGSSASAVRRFIRGYSETIVSPMNCSRKFDSENMRSILRSLQRNVAYPLKISSLSADTDLQNNTVSQYLAHLRDQYILYELESWNPNLRSKAAIRSGKVIHFCDPAIAAYFLSASPADILYDPATFGLLFESLVVHDLRVYVRSVEGRIMHYRDSDGLEADAIIRLNDGRWAAVEVKLGHAWADEAAKNLKRLAEKVDQKRMGPPSFLAVIVPSGFGYVRDDGVMVVPITCLRDRSLTVNGRSKIADYIN